MKFTAFFTSSCYSTKNLFLAILVLSTSSCIRRQTNLSNIDNAPAGYVTEATCLRLISGQEIVKQSSIKTVSASCGETCECHCSSVHPKAVNTGKINAKVPAKTSPIVTYKAAPKKIVAANSVKPKVVVVKEDTLVKEKETSTRASLSPKAVVANGAASGSTKGDANIRAVQEALNQKGAKLEVDGVMGDRTVRLLRAFQTMNDLPVTGKADESTAKALGLDISK